MKNLNYNKLKIFVSILIVSLFFCFHHLIQQKIVYNNVFKPLFLNYVPNDTNKLKAEVPYQKIHNNNLKSWDARIYLFIKDNLYDAKKMGGDYIFASFPLFPLVWKLSHLPPWGIMLLNIILFIISINILTKLFEDENDDKWVKISLFSILFTFPGSTVFYIPYSEALFMLLVTIAIFGIIKDKYWIYCIGIFLAAMTRSVAVILIATFFAAELLKFLENKQIKVFLINFSKKIVPLILGTFAASLIQYINGSGSLFKFIEVQKYWDYKFQMPQIIKEWSEEGFGSSVATIFFIVAPALIYLIYLFFLKLNDFKNKKVEQIKNTDKKEYLFNLSLIYAVGIFLFILFFKGGNLYGTPRYIITTPFFFIIVYVGILKLKSLPNVIKYSMFGILLFLSWFFICMVSYAISWGFSDFGYILFVASLAFILLNKSLIHYKILFVILIFMNILWATYLFNMFLTNAWIAV